MYVAKNSAGTGYDIVADTPSKYPDYITAKGSLTVFINFDTGIKPDVDTNDIHDAIAKAVSDLTGATDVKVYNRGAALVKNAPVS